MTELRVGFVGGGGIARVHAPQVLRDSNARLVGIADRDPERARRFATEHGVEAVHDSVESLIAGERPDVVHVLVPPQAHAAVAMQAVEMGCHVLVEKPMATSAGDARRLTELADRRGVRLCVNHNGVLHEVIRRALDMARAGCVGEIVSVEAHEVYNPERNPSFVEPGAESRHWAYRLNGGPLQDMVPHPISLLLEFLDDVVELERMEIHRGVFPAGWPDELRLLMRSETVLGYVNVSVGEKPDVESFAIRGTEGILVADSYNEIVTLRRPPRLPRKVERGLSGLRLAGQYVWGSVANGVRVATGRMDTSNGIGSVIEAFYEAIRTGGPPPIPGPAGVRVVEVIDRIWPEPRPAPDAVGDRADR